MTSMANVRTARDPNHEFRSFNNHLDIINDFQVSCLISTIFQASEMEKQQ